MKDLHSVDWHHVRTSLNEKGFCQVDALCSAAECKALTDLYHQPIFRSVINMQRYRFGRGEYKYFNYPLPGILQILRENFYPYLAEVANTWSSVLGGSAKYPNTLSEFTAICHAQDQKRPTPLILHYGPGGYNTLHQDLYGEVYFPFQVVIVLSQPGKDFDGGEFVMTEQLPRAQSKANVLAPKQGDAVIFTTNFRPVQGAKGYYKAKMRHGVSEISSGERYALGMIFHDAN
ncbi:MAG TPA: 2OG-Fe(II) oxygenase [Cyclobacteriaceae bacterium]|nr:2OG-Fe(II) oxygenase [Cyclobacteriaceae bacterium]